MTGLQIIENQNQRVMLTSQLAESYETTTDTITKNFNRNIERYQEGKHFFCLVGDDLREFRANGQIDLSPNLNKLYLWTEKGAMLHAKSLNTDKAWEMYDILVDTYFKVKEQKAVLSQLSPQLQLLINIEVKQKEQDIAIADTNKKLDTIGDIISLNSNAWRTDSKNLIVKIAHAMGGNDYIRDVNHTIYTLLNSRFAVSLERRLSFKRGRMADNGASKSERDKLTKVDIIAEDKKLIEGYLAIIKELAVKYGVWKEVI